MADFLICEFRELPGVAKALRGPHVASPTAAINALKRYRVAVASGDGGSITVWRDDKKNYRVDFSVYLNTRAKNLFASKVKTLEWIKEYWPKMKERP